MSIDLILVMNHTWYWPSLLIVITCRICHPLNIAAIDTIPNHKFPHNYYSAGLALSFEGIVGVAIAGFVGVIVSAFALYGYCMCSSR
jgi:hypothetical protein